MQAAEELNAVEQFKSSTLKKLDGLTCQAHNKRPMVDFHGATLREVQITMRCCCRRLSVLANEAIARAT